MAFSDIQTSFGAGELSQNLYARVDLKQYSIGAALLRNFFVDYRGGASTRPGMQYIATCLSQGSPRIIGFQESTDATYVLELGSFYMQIYSEGTFIQMLTSPWTEEDLPLLKFVQSADIMTFTHQNYPPYLLKRTTPTTFSLAPQDLGPKQAPPSGLAAITNAAGGAVFSGYCVTAISSDGKEESLASNIVYIGHTASGKNASLTWSAPTGVTPLQYHIYKIGPVPESGSGSARFGMNSSFGYLGSSLSPQYDDSGDVAQDYAKQPPQFTDPFTPDQPQGVNVTAPAGPYGALTPPAVTFSAPPSGITTTGHSVLNNTGGVGGVIIDISGGPYTAGAPTVTIAGGATAVVSSLSADTGTYPGCCSYFQQRQCFASSFNQPQTIWLSQIGNPFNFNASDVVQGGDAITLGLASRQVNRITSMVPMPTGMVLLTTGGAWLLSGGGQTLGVTPTNIAAQPQASSGANDMPPIVVNNNILYVQSRGSAIRDLVYNFYVNSYFGTDRTVLANQLFFGHTLKEWCYSEEPFRTLYVIRDDGIGLVMTYMPDQEMYAWSHMDTNGLLVSTCSVVEGNHDAVYFVVKRPVNGVYTNFIERLDDRNWRGNVEFAWCLDSALQLPQVFPSAILQITDDGRAVASGNIFAPGDVGKIIRGINGGKALVTGYLGANNLEVTIQSDGLGNKAFPLLPDSELIAPIASGAWTMNAQVNGASGLDHLIGETVTALADGMVIDNLVVSPTGTINFGRMISFATVGLKFQAKLQTLYLDIDGGETIQGKRKMLPTVTCRLQDTRGIKVGTTFDALHEFRDPVYAQQYATPTPLYSGDLTEPIFAAWTTEGQICIQQDYPLPATVLGLIPQVVRGDTGR